MADLVDNISASQWSMLRINNKTINNKTIVEFRQFRPIQSGESVFDAEMALEMSVWQTLCTALGPEVWR